MTSQVHTASSKGIIIILSVILIVSFVISSWLYSQRTSLATEAESQRAEIEERVKTEKNNRQKINQLQMALSEQETVFDEQQESLNQQQQKVNELKLLIDKLQSASNVADTRHQQEVNSLQHFKSLQSQLNHDLITSQKKLSLTKTELSINRAELDSVLIKLTKSQQQTERQVTKNKRQNEALETLKRQLSLAKMEFGDVRHQLTEQNRLNKTLTVGLDSTKYDLNKSRQRAKQYSSKISSLVDEIDSVKQQYSKTEAKLETVKYLNEELKIELTFAEKELMHQLTSFNNVTKTKQQLDDELVTIQQKLLTSRSSLNTKQVKLNSVEKTLSAVKLTAKQRAEEIKERNSAIDSLQTQLSHTGTKITNLKNRFTVFELKSDILFNKGKAGLKIQGRETLSILAELFRKYPDRQISIQGHTDNQKIGNRLKRLYATNWELAAARAGSAIRYLQDHENIEPQRMVLVSYSQYQPLRSNDSLQGMAGNRRIEIILMPEDFSFFRQTTDQPLKTVSQ